MIKSASRSSITNDQKYRSMLAGTVPPSEYLIETRILPSNAGSIVFDNLAQYSGIYKHLQVVVVANCVTAASNQFLRLNGDNGNNYAWHYLEGNGTTTFSGGGGSLSFMGWGVTNADTNNFTASVIDVLDPYSSTKNTTIRALTGSARSGNNWLGLYSGAWFNTAPVTSLSIGFGTQSLLAGSRFSLYGVTA